MGTAANRLRKALMYKLASQLGLCKCFRCGEPIEDPDGLSVEHKESWLDSQNPVGLFFDLENVAFSHFRCNISVARKVNRKTTEAKKEMRREGYRRYYARLKADPFRYQTRKDKRRAYSREYMRKVRARIPTPG